MPIELTNIIFSAIGVIVTGLASWGTTIFVKWLNTKIKDKNFNLFSETFAKVITDIVKAVYQTYVEELKGTNAWTKEAQQQALLTALNAAKKALSKEILEYILEQYNDIDEYIRMKIESTLYDLKNNSNHNENNKS